MYAFIYVLCWLFLSSAFASPPTPKVVEVISVVPQNFSQSVRLVGTIKAQRQNVLIAKVPGVLDHIAQAGTHLKKGAIIARIENADLDRSLSYAKEGEALAKGQHHRISELVKSNYSSKAKLEERKQSLLDARQKLARSQIELDQSRFIAPFDGVVGNYKKREGDQVQVGDLILTFYDPTGLLVDFDIPAQYLKDIKDNQPVVIQGKTYHLGKAQYIVDEESYMSPVSLNLECKDCYVGELVDVDLMLHEKKSVLVIPFEAVVRRNDKDMVYVVQKGKAEITPVTLGLREKENIEITDGLKVGDKVIVKNPDRLYPEMDVKILEPAKKG